MNNKNESEMVIYLTERIWHWGGKPESRTLKHKLYHKSSDLTGIVLSDTR